MKDMNKTGGEGREEGTTTKKKQKTKKESKIERKKKDKTKKNTSKKERQQPTGSKAGRRDGETYREEEDSVPQTGRSPSTQL